MHLIYFASIAELKQLPAGSSAAFALDSWGIDSGPSPASSSTAGSFAAGPATSGLSSAGAHDFFRNCWFLLIIWQFVMYLKLCCLTRLDFSFGE